MDRALDSGGDPVLLLRCLLELKVRELLVRVEYAAPAAHAHDEHRGARCGVGHQEDLPPRWALSP